VQVHLGGGGEGRGRDWAEGLFKKSLHKGSGWRIHPLLHPLFRQESLPGETPTGSWFGEATFP